MVLFYLQVCNESEGSCNPSGDRVYSDHRIFCDLVGDNLSSPRSGELADIAWGNVGLPSRLQNVGSLEERLQKYFFNGPYEVSLRALLYGGRNY